MASPQESNRRYALVASLFVVVLLLVVFGSLFGMCREEGDTADQIAPTEQSPAAPGVE